MNNSDSVLYLWDYPYGCSEQLSSKILALVTVQDMMEAFKLKQLPSKREINKWVNKALKTMKDRQLKDGGFGM